MSVINKLAECLSYNIVELSSGKKSSYYFNLKPFLFSSYGARFIANNYSFVNADAIAGMELGAVPILTAVSMVTGLDCLVIRKDRKGYGLKNRIEGVKYSRRSRIAIFDDVTTSGNSLLEVAQVLRSEDYIVERAFSIIDREEGASNLLSSNGIQLESLYKSSEILKLC